MPGWQAGRVTDHVGTTIMGMRGAAGRVTPPVGRVTDHVGLGGRFVLDFSHRQLFVYYFGFPFSKYEETKSETQTATSISLSI